MTGGSERSQGSGGGTRPLPASIRGSGARYTVLMGHPLHAAAIKPRSPSPREDRAKAYRGRPDGDVAQYQWRRLTEALHRLAVDIFVIPADRKCPDLVCAGEAGVVSSRSGELSLADKQFIATTPVGSDRAHLHFERVIRGIGFRVQRCEMAFAGRSDLIEVGDESILTWGETEAGRRLLGRGAAAFGTARSARERLSALLGNRRIMEMQLVDPRYSRGSYCATAIGPGRRVLMVNVNAFHDDARRVILTGKIKATDYIIPLTDQDAAMYAADSFEIVDRNGRRHLLIPEGVSDELLGRIEAVGVHPVPIAMSEWIKKDRGGIRSLICDLGWICDDRRTLLPEITDFRKSIRFRPS